MFIVEPFDFAREFVKNIARTANINPTAYAVIRMYDTDPVKYPALRDRTNEMVGAVSGMSGKDRSESVIMDYSGSEMYREFGFEAVGAQFSAKFRVIFS